MQDNAPTVIASTDSYLGLVAALRERCAELKMTYETVEAVAGLTRGPVDKIFRAEPTKNFCPMSFDAIIGALRLKNLLADDPLQRERVLKQWQYRPRSFGRRVRNKRTRELLVKEAHYIVWRATNEHMHRMRLARTVKTTPAQRQASARKAARARWDAKARALSAE